MDFEEFTKLSRRSCVCGSEGWQAVTEFPVNFSLPILTHSLVLSFWGGRIKHCVVCTPTDVMIMSQAADDDDEV